MVNVGFQLYFGDTLVGHVHSVSSEPITRQVPKKDENGSPIGFTQFCNCRRPGCPRGEEFIVTKWEDEYIGSITTLVINFAKICDFEELQLSHDSKIRKRGLTIRCGDDVTDLVKDNLIVWAGSNVYYNPGALYTGKVHLEYLNTKELQREYSRFSLFSSVRS